MTRTDKARAKFNDTRQKVEQARSGGGERARAYARGTVKGFHYLELVEPIKQLKREKKLEEALELCYTAIEGAEVAAKFERRCPPPFYTRQAATVLRRLGRKDEEIAVLDRYLELVYRLGGFDRELEERLARLRGSS